ncbi:MAG: DUF4262 domain-containing protein [Deltaproteobacteria bacterium]|nr:DUF4262 domain-containing protein [Deltaproteobacteria bacterium]
MKATGTNAINTLLMQVSGQLKQHGWAMVCLEYGGHPYIVTIGLERAFGHPELETLGLPEELGRKFLGELVARIKEGVRFHSGDFFSDMVRGYDLFLVRNPLNPDGPSLTGKRLRLVWPDARHRYPWHSDCDADCAVQRLLPRIEGLSLEGFRAMMAQVKNAS